MTFLLAFYSMDSSSIFKDYVPKFFDSFRFYCVEKHYTRWETGVTPAAEILFTMHVIIIFMYSTINLMVLSTVPYKYNRFKDKKEKKHRTKGKCQKEENTG